MTSRWVIFFSLAAVWLAPAGRTATVSGRVELPNAKNYSGVVVWLDPVSGVFPESKPAALSMAHKNKTFVPHLLALRVGSKVSFPNLDPFFHNAFSNYEGQVFDIGLHPPRSSREVTFSRPGIVRLFCNIHPTMGAVIVVLQTPWFAVSNSKGAYEIDDVPPGEYRVHVFHERALENVLGALERNVTVSNEDMTLPPMVISEAGYIAPPHKNKFGKDYPPVVVDQYPGRKQ